MKRTLAYYFWKRRLVILVHTKDAPTDAEWKVYCDDVRQWCKSIRGILVISDGGGPNTVQRADLEAALDNDTYKAKTAVVTLSRIARGIVTAMSWFNSGIKSFSTVQVRPALEYLEVPTVEHDQVIAQINQLKAEIGVPP